MSKKGVALIISFLVIVVLTILSAAILLRSINERYIAQRYLESTQAFWLAEAGVSRAMKELSYDFSLSGPWSESMGGGRYSVSVSGAGQTRTLTSSGYIPEVSPRIERTIEVILRKYIPPSFYDNAIYSAGDVDFNGNSYSVIGNVRYYDEIDNTGNVTGTITQDSTISPLARLDFVQLREISTSQGNIYDATRLLNVQRGRDSFPASFWYTPPTDPSDPTTGVPNVVYVENDLELRGNIGTIGGFYVVVGDVITYPDQTYDAEINGNGQVEGVIYTRGEFDINGGGGRLNINGGVLAGEEARLNGNATITYNRDYMSAIQALNINVQLQIESWEDMNKAYKFTS